MPLILRGGSLKEATKRAIARISLITIVFALAFFFASMAFAESFDDPLVEGCSSEPVRWIAVFELRGDCTEKISIFALNECGELVDYDETLSFWCDPPEPDYPDHEGPGRDGRISKVR